ncbi:MAG: hypothetical protein ACFB0Z_04900 [Candidatus Phaeomarinobacter sp.]
MADFTSNTVRLTRLTTFTGSKSTAISAATGLSLLLAGCIGVDTSSPKVAAVQAQPAAAPVAQPYQVASAPVVLSDGTIVPIPRAKPAVAGKSLDRVTRADAAQAAPLDGPKGLVEKAAAYRAFDAAIDDLADRKFKSPRDVRAALDSLRPHDPAKLGEGWVANSAFLAAQQPEFVSALKAAVARDGKQSVLSRLKSGTGVWMFAGSQQARSAVVADASVAYQKLTGLGQRFLTTAVEFQRTRWGSYEPAAPFSVSPQFAAAEVGGPGLGNILAELAGVTEAQAAAPVMQRILAIAGHIALEESDASATVSLVQNRDLSRCTRFARLNLNQCLAAAHFPSEEAYCTGKHAVNEIAYCWATYLPAAAK